MVNMKTKTGRIDCECGDQIISNSGKAMHKFPNIAYCWNPACKRAFDYDAVEKARKEGEAVVFHPPGKGLKVFKMNDYDWWMDFDLESAKKNYWKHLEEITNPENEDIIEACEMTEKQLKNYKFISDELYNTECSFLEELQRKQSITDKPEFFASTEF